MYWWVSLHSTHYAMGSAVTSDRYFATCARGLETILADELRALGATIAPGRGGTAFAGDMAMLFTRQPLRGRPCASSGRSSRARSGLT